MERGRRKSTHQQAVLGIYGGKSQSDAYEGVWRGKMQQKSQPHPKTKVRQRRQMSRKEKCCQLRVPPRCYL